MTEIVGNNTGWYWHLVGKTYSVEDSTVSVPVLVCSVFVLRF